METSEAEAGAEEGAPETMRIVLQLAYIVAIIAGLLAMMAAAYYTICWVTLIAVRFIPIIGKRHRHADWKRLNR